MDVDGTRYRTIGYDETRGLWIIDQTRLPHEFVIVTLDGLDEVVRAIADMQVRGAPLIGATAAYGLALALREDPSAASEQRAAERLLGARPTAVNLSWAVDRVRKSLLKVPEAQRARRALEEAEAICDEDVATCSAIGDHGLEILRRCYEAREAARSAGERGGPLQVLTHCNAGWLATVDWGTALAPIYKAVDAGIPVHVWVDETRPRNQGASLTAWELAHAGVPHTVIVDNAGGHIMQHGQVDLCLVGSDRTTAHGDVCNKIGTYLKALAAHDNGVPFYVALPVSSIDWTLRDGLREIPIEERPGSEVREVRGRTVGGVVEAVSVAPEESPAANYAFDVTPARLVTALITEHGVFAATPEDLSRLRERARR